MTTDLWMLVATVGLYWLLVMIAATPAMVDKGLTWAAGNREDPYEKKGWEVRADRTVANFLENLPIFAALVLVAHVSGSANGTTALGAQIFFGARLVHAIVYFAGIPWIRTLAWAISVVGMFMIASALFG